MTANKLPSSNCYPFLTIIFWLTILFLNSCVLQESQSDKKDGTDVDNALLKGAVYQNNLPVDSAKVVLMYSDYNPWLNVMGLDSVQKAYVTYTDKNGNYEFLNLKNRMYSLEVIHNTNMMDWQENLDLSQKHQIVLNANLKPALVVVIPVPKKLKGSDFYICLPGSSVFGKPQTVFLDSNVYLSPMPRKAITQLVYAYTDSIDIPAQPLLSKPILPTEDQDTIWISKDDLLIE